MIARKLLWTLMTVLALLVGAYALVVGFVPGFQPPFARELLLKWPITAVCHFSGGAVALMVGAFQVNGRLRARLPGLHRWAGRAYVLAVSVGALAGLSMAFNATGGRTAQIGFGLLAFAWLLSTAAAFLHVRQRNIGAHRNWMIRSYALTLAAVTLRIYLPTSVLAGISFEVAYPAIAWLCWVPNLIAAEWIVRSGLLAPAPSRLSLEASRAA